MKSKLVVLLVSAMTIFALVVVGCAPKAGPGEVPAPAPEAEIFTWNVQSTYSLGTPTSLAVAELLEKDILALTGGRLKITFHGPGAITPAYEGLEGIQDGILDGAHITLADERGKFGYVADLFNQFACGPTSPEMSAWTHMGDGMALQNEALQKAGFTNVLVAEQVDMQGAEDELMSTVPITRKEDYKGLKIRTFGYWGKILEQSGAAIVTLPGAEVYPALERGVIDACELGTPAGNYALGFNEIADYWYSPGVHSPGNVHYLMVNKNSWNELPDDIKFAVKRACIAKTFDIGNMLAIEDAKARQAVKDYGCIVEPLPMDVQAWIVARADEMWEQFGKEDAWYKEVYDNQYAFLEVYRGLASEMLPNIKAIRDYGKEHGIS